MRKGGGVGGAKRGWVMFPRVTQPVTELEENPGILGELCFITVPNPETSGLPLRGMWRELRAQGPKARLWTGSPT